ncbi:aspartyl protease family protein 1-like [Durio zibethinus]|uniref:Aspartyl protease family protein 1-like n=1 Tax=Durio zibethinus TaxID=66656 RepID=A0A6P5ZH23_DURZI|nr:aspartyl protease family protein 1-like [Durio zibethinus]
MLSLLKTVFFFWMLIWVLSFTLSYGRRRIFTFEMLHRFSEPVKNWSFATGKLSHWPVKGSFEYYAVLAHHDRLLRGRKLSDINATLSFSDGNSTFQISSLGFLHYTTVQLGTPGVKFMVALDTGSDLLWVPCDCTKCAPTEGTTYASDFELSIYDPKGSSTNKKVTCNSSLCAHRNQCLGTFSNCPYMVSYMSAQTSTSGVLVEDVLHLTTEDDHAKFVEAYVTFGCGQVQSGSFLDVAAPNGLLGLGMEKIAVPSILSQEGLTTDSFSMCFGHDGVGTISFGDQGSPDQEETPFNLNPSHPTYNITVTQIRVGTTLIGGDFTALFDSGTSFTYLVDPTYSNVAKNFHSQALDRWHPLDPRIPFEYCYDMSPGANASLIPSMSLIMKGGSHFPVYDPIIVISTQIKLVYCLAVIKSTELNIIGQNFMTGYRVVFDRERFVLGWKKFDCYNVETKTSEVESHPASAPPTSAAGIHNYSTPESTKDIRNNNSRTSVALRSCHPYVSVLSFFGVVFLLPLLL